MVFATETQTVEARFPIPKDERLRVLSETDTGYRVEVKRGSWAVALDVSKKTKGLKRIELADAGVPPVQPAPIKPAPSIVAAPAVPTPHPRPPAATSSPPSSPVSPPSLPAAAPSVVASTQVVIVAAGQTGEPPRVATMPGATGTTSTANGWTRYRFWPDSFKWPATSNDWIRFLIEYRVYAASGFGGLLLILLLIHRPRHLRRRPMPPVHSMPKPRPIAAPSRARDLVPPPRPVKAPPVAPLAPVPPPAPAHEPLVAVMAAADSMTANGASASTPSRPRLESRRVGSSAPTPVPDEASDPASPLPREGTSASRHARPASVDAPPPAADGEADSPVVLKLSKPVAPFAAERSPESTILMNLGALANATGKDTVHLRKDKPEPSAAGGPAFVLKNMGKIGKYEVEEVLGQGSMGVVYRARQPELHRVVALKMLISGMHASPKHREKFMLEARAMAQLRHPNIVTVYDVDEYEGQPFFAMEYIEGTSLDKLIYTHTWSNAEVAEVAAKISDAIQYAHSRGIIHRDLKPANVIVAKSGEPLITDFGLARNLQVERSSRHGEIIGTPSYMAPEQARGRPEEIDARTDIYAVGAILYTLMTRREPFLGGTLLETLAAVLQHNPTPIREINPLADERLVEICEKAMQKYPPMRYQTAHDMLEALVQYVYIAPR